MKRIMITEQQLGLIEEGFVKDRFVRKVVKELDHKYEPSHQTLENESGPINKALVRKKYDGEEYEPKDVFREFNEKYDDLSEEFVKQVIKDWFNGSMGKNYSLTKNVKMKKDHSGE